ncbi:MAG: MBL fold metallo-hydrolase [Agathobacter sp.]|nr:MBL fold metallo-hydrolase [Agathobacter sp.]
MKLKCLGSGSSGNCYLLSTETETLILDCGIPIMEIKKGLDFNLSKVVGVCATHAHLDHSKSVMDLEKMGLKTFYPYLGERHEISVCDCMGDFLIKDFALTSINGNFMHTHADGLECPCYGFLITHPQLGRMLYITDTELIKWRFKDINHILISCNYQQKYVKEDNLAKRNHVLRGHMELETVKEFIKANNSSALQNIILCHLSTENANAEEMLAEVQKVAKNANVSVARKGLEVELSNGNECPF